MTADYDSRSTKSGGASTEAPQAKYATKTRIVIEDNESTVDKKIRYQFR